MYVDSSEACNDLTFQLGQMGVGTSVAARQWSIKITQYSCDHPNLAPDGCTQYFFGSASQTVQTFNFAGGQHLANQDQNICVRRERGNCRICWTTQQPADFAVSGPTAGGAFVNGAVSYYVLVIVLLISILINRPPRHAVAGRKQVLTALSFVEPKPEPCPKFLEKDFVDVSSVWERHPIRWPQLPFAVST